MLKGSLVSSTSIVIVRGIPAITALVHVIVVALVTVVRVGVVPSVVVSAVTFVVRINRMSR